MPSNVSATTALPGPTAPTQRLAWLDGLRGLAALAVAAHHFGAMRFIPGGERFARHCDLGIFGVFLFFIISGWIIPASLERRGDVRRFWVGRVFRIYPLICVVVAACFLLPTGYSPVHQHLPTDLGWSLLANLTLLHDFLGVPSAVSVLWTLGFEMIFYYLTTALFVAGRERSVGTPVAFAALAVVGGVSTTCAWLTTTWSSPTARHALILVTLTATVGGLALILSGSRTARHCGAYLLAALGLGVLLLNARAPLFECATILATMFAGTVCYRLRAGQVRRTVGLSVVGFVIAAGIAAGLAFNHQPRSAQTWTRNVEAYVLPFVAAWVIFGLGLVLSTRTWPAVLSWLGRISYSMYLVHVPLMWTVFWFKDSYLHLPAGHRGRFIVLLIDCALLPLVSELTYRFVELPGQRIGRRVAARFQPVDEHEHRAASDTLPVS